MSITPKHLRLCMRLLFCVPIVAMAGCGDNSGRGAESIEIARSAKPRFPMVRPTFQPAKTRGLPSNTRH